MPRSPLKVNSWRALTLLLVFSVFVSLVLIEAGAQGRRLQPSQSTAPGSGPQQTRRKNIASVRSVDTTDGSRVSITSDVPLNDYEAYWGGDRFFVIIPNAEITYQNVQTLQASLRGRGFQDVRIERKGNDLVFSFRMQSGFRARPEQKFNRLDIILTAPPGTTFNRNENRNTGQGIRPGGGTTVGTELGNTSNRSTGTGNTTTRTGGTGGTGGTRNTTGGGSSSSSGGGSGGSTIAGTSSGGGGSRRGGGGGGTRGGSGAYSGYRGSGGGDRGGGTPLNIPLPSAIQTPTPSAGAPSTDNNSANTSASPLASPGAGEGTAQANASPTTSLSPTPEQIARNEPQSPVTAPPTTTTTNTPAPAANTGFAAAVKEYWLPLLIGLLVLGAIVLLMASRSRAGASEARETERLQTKKQETIKEKPASRTGAAVAGGVAGAAAVAAMAKESRAKAAPTKENVKAEETKAVEPTAPAVGMEQIGTEVKSLLDGKDYDESVISSSNPDTRQIVSTELLAALASRNPERRLRAREAFVKHGFFDEATRRLRTSTVAAERISAARALGLTQEHNATPPLVAALEDDDPEVRRASVNALAELRDPSAIGPLNALLEREKNRKVPHSLIRRAIEASATIDLPETTAQTAPPPPPPPAAAKDATATSAEKKDKDDEDREVFEI